MIPKSQSVLYTSFQPYTVEMARLLQEKYQWTPVYWITKPNIDGVVRQHFPGAVTHDAYEALKTIPARPFLQSRIQCPDPSLLERLVKRQLEAMSMFDRQDSHSDDLTYRQRMELYIKLLRYWTYVLKTLKVDVVMFEEGPHNVSNYILYSVAGELGIKTPLFWQTLGKLGVISAFRFEEGCWYLRETYLRLLNQPLESCQLSPELKQYSERLQGSYDVVLQDHLANQAKGMRQLMGEESTWRKIRERVGKLGRLFQWRKNLENIRMLTGQSSFESEFKERGKELVNSSLPYWKWLYYKRVSIRKKRKVGAYYEAIANRSPDLSIPYVFCGLQYQPEKSTLPDGELFANQRLMVELLADAIPSDWKIYVKEHPSQVVMDFCRYGELSRSREYYDDLRALAKVELISMTRDSFSLIDGSKAVASVTGTVCWEGVFRQKPGLCFGHSWYLGCEGIFEIHKRDDLESAIKAIEKGFVPEIERVETFLKAMEEVAVQGVVGGEHKAKARGIGVMENAAEHLRGLERLYAEREMGKD